jgi:hypothetical protein
MKSGLKPRTPCSVALYAKHLQVKMRFVPTSPALGGLFGVISNVDGIL